MERMLFVPEEGPCYVCKRTVRSDETQGILCTIFADGRPPALNIYCEKDHPLKQRNGKILITIAGEKKGKKVPRKPAL